MCRSIKVLRRAEPEPPPGEEEIRAAALQFVRKVSGYVKPSKANHDVFYQAVEEVTEATCRLMQQIQSSTKRLSSADKSVRPPTPV